MAECHSCGAPLAEGEALCHACGEPVEGSTASFGPVHAEEPTATSTAPSIDGPCLVVRKGAQSGERFFLDRPSLTVGRDPESDIFLNDMTVSRTHAVFSVIGGTVSVADKGSLNGTYVNGLCVDSADLCTGDVVQIGTFQMVFYAGQEEAR